MSALSIGTTDGPYLVRGTKTAAAAVLVVSERARWMRSADERGCSFVRHPEVFICHSPACSRASRPETVSLRRR
jgi:hypothetical protein